MGARAMIRDFIIQLAEGYGIPEFKNNESQADNILHFAAIVAAVEREACEQICERRKSLYWMEFDKTGSDADRAAAIASEECADAIRARGQ
jgi:hypothetical protein